MEGFKMASRQPGLNGLIPYAEVVIRPEDSRPIVITLIELEDESWDAEVSQGSAGDMDEAINVLQAMVSMAMAMANVRRSASSMRERLYEVTKGDEPPF
jgi:DNA polymerase III delta prime subunit